MEVKVKRLGFISFSEACEELACSREYLYGLIRKGILQQYYLDQNSTGKGKSYFKVDEMEKAFTQKRVDDLLD